LRERIERDWESENARACARNYTRLNYKALRTSNPANEERGGRGEGAQLRVIERASGRNICSDLRLSALKSN